MLPAHVERRHLVLAGGGCVALAVVGLIDPSLQALGPPCPLQALTGLDCPLCGATRATHALLGGDVVQALDFNALYVLSLPLLIVAGLFWLRSGTVPAVFRHPRAGLVALTVAGAFLVVRNLPSFTVLAA